jgi:translation initiation factor 2B subunit (eIF-2B alpha/beta/delta family)
MAKARTRQTDNKVSMEEATSLGGRRKALAARRSKTELAALRETLKTEAKTPKNKAKIASALKTTAAKGKDKLPPTALRLINPTYHGMDVIPEKLADGLKKHPRL